MQRLARDLLILADPYNIHGISGLQILSCIIYICYFIAVWLIKIMECLRVPQLEFFNILQGNASSARCLLCLNWLLRRKNIGRSPLAVLHTACRNNDSFSPDQRLGTHVTFQEDMYELQLQISFHGYQIESQQIYQNDWRSHQIM